MTPKTALITLIVSLSVLGGTPCRAGDSPAAGSAADAYGVLRDWKSEKDS